jgi:hypothetical protein
LNTTNLHLEHFLETPSNPLVRYPKSKQAHLKQYVHYKNMKKYNEQGEHPSRLLRKLTSLMATSSLVSTVVPVTARQTIRATGKAIAFASKHSF